MKKFLLIVFFLLLNVISVNALNEKKPLNIIYILVDDLGYGDVNLQMDNLDVFNNPHVKTPNLARLAKESMVFTHHYASAPVCSPSRAGLLTGKTPTRFNIMRWINDKNDNGEMFLPGKAVTIPEILRDHGYQTAVFGKWHLNGADWTEGDNWTGWTGSFPNQQGFDYAMVTKENPHESTNINTNTQKNPGDFYLDKARKHGIPLGKLKGFSGQIITDSAMHWIQHKRDPGQPYFLYLPYDAVHEQVESPVAYNNLYNTGNAMKDRYYANITYLDAQIGRLLDFFLAQRMEENTIIFFSSDNGPEVLESYWLAPRSFGTSAPLSGQKKHLYEGGIRVPGMVKWSGKIQPGVSALPNSTLDVLPTICKMTGINLPENIELDGTSILPYLVNGKEIHRDKPLYWQTELEQNWQIQGVSYNKRYDGTKSLDLPVPKVAIRQGDYVLRGFSSKEAPFSRPDIFQLYNVVQDRQELVELSKFKPQIFAQMKKELREMWEDVNADRQQVQSEIAKRLDQRK